MKIALLPCPFCGTTPTIEPWHGGLKTKRMISCDNHECRVNPSVAGATAEEAAKYWNRRPR